MTNLILLTDNGLAKHNNNYCIPQTSDVTTSVTVTGTSTTDYDRGMLYGIVVSLYVVTLALSSTVPCLLESNKPLVTEGDSNFKEGM